MFFAEENERKLRVEKAADLRYGELPQLQQRYQALEEKLKGLGSLVRIHPLSTLTLSTLTLAFVPALAPTAVYTLTSIYTWLGLVAART